MARSVGKREGINYNLNILDGFDCVESLSTLPFGQISRRAERNNCNLNILFFLIVLSPSPLFYLARSVGALKAIIIILMSLMVLIVLSPSPLIHLARSVGELKAIIVILMSLMVLIVLSPSPLSYLARSVGELKEVIIILMSLMVLIVLSPSPHPPFGQISRRAERQ